MAKTNTKLPDGITLEQLASNWSLATAAYNRPFRRIRLLDATDRGKLWEAINSKFPSYQILPDTNDISYVKNNLLASLYTVGKSASLLPTTPEDKEIVEHLNIWLAHFWDVAKLGFYQMQAGERAALTNLGITQVGWDKNLSGGSGSYAYKGGPAYKNIDPTKFMRDPYAETLETSAYCMTWEDLHKSVLKANPLYAETLDAAIKTSYSSTAAPVELHLDRPSSSEVRTSKDYYRLITHWVRDGNKIHEIHTLDNSAILCVREDIKPSAFPFALVHCNLPAGDVIGTSECAKIFANTVAYNLMNSVLLTAEYKNQRPPRFISNTSGLNVVSFVKHGNEADYTFVVNGDASRAVHYHQFPQPSPVAPTIMGLLKTDMQRVSGVDGRYTGRDTGSILTTGGVEAMINQATLVDTPKILNYEEYARTLTQLTLANMMEFAPQRKYFIKNPKDNKYCIVEVDFPALDKDAVFQYSINISSELPKNKARIAQMANTLMEKQMQYKQSGGQVDLITPEEWLMCQDLPERELMQDRMGIQRDADYLTKITKVLYTYSGMVQNGMDPKDAMLATAQELKADEQPGSPYPEELGMGGGGMPPQEEYAPQENYVPNVDSQSTQPYNGY